MITKTMQRKIKTHLISSGVKQVELAKELGVSRQQLNAVVNGRVENIRLEIKVLEKLGLKK